MEKKKNNSISSTNKTVKKSTGFTLKEVAIIVIVTSIIGTINGSFLTNTIIKDEIKQNNKANTTSDTALNDFIESYNAVKNNYYKKVKYQDLIDGAIDGMVKKLDDPHSSYFTKKDLASFNEQLEGDYQGIGAEIGKKEDGTLYITRIFDNSPASSVGLQQGDIMKKVNDKDLSGKTTKETSNMIKGEKGTKVKIEILRNNETITYDIKRDVVQIESVVSTTKEENNKTIGYIGIETFSENTFSQFEKAIKDMENKKVSGIIIDVRSNPGGYLHIVDQMAELIIPKDKIVYQIKENDKTTEYKSKNKNTFNIPIIMLINEESASASEILTISLKESYGASVIGKTSYGKGTVQEVHNLSSGGMVKYTTKEWLSPNGNSINESGVKPDMEVEYTDGQTDLQLKSAIEKLTQ